MELNAQSQVLHDALNAALKDELESVTVIGVRKEGDILTGIAFSPDADIWKHIGALQVETTRLSRNCQRGGWFNPPEDA